MKLNPEQRKYLTNRVYQVHKDAPGKYDPITFPETTAVKRANAQIAAAQKVIGKFEDEKKKLKEIRDKRISKMSSVCHRAIQFESAEDALKLVDEFAATQF
jgi:hypothetical protein